jgi:hypothetical protein
MAVPWGSVRAGGIGKAGFSGHGAAGHRPKLRADAEKAALNARWGGCRARAKRDHIPDAGGTWSGAIRFVGHNALSREQVTKVPLAVPKAEAEQEIFSEK